MKETEFEAFKVVFKTEMERPKQGEIFITPAYSSKKEFLCSLCVLLPNSEETLVGELYLSFLSVEDASQGFIDELFTEELTLEHYLAAKNSQGIYLESKGKPIFYSLLPSIQDYRGVVRQLGVGLSKKFLLAINDLVIAKQADTTFEWFKRATSSPIFRRKFMRDSEPFFAFHNAETVLNGAEFEELDSISKSLTLTFQLDSFANKHDINFLFDSNHVIPKRINILIGKNGLGKSQALNKFCRAALQYEGDKNNLTDGTTLNGRPMISRILAIGTPGETSTTFPNERTDQKLLYRRLNVTRKGRAAKNRNIGLLLTELSRNDNDIGQNRRWDIFRAAIENMISFEEMYIRLTDKSIAPLAELGRRGRETSLLDLWSRADTNADPLRKIDDKPFPLSSGQLTFFKFALLCCHYIEKGSFVMMDEPETHLHPNMISDFVAMLDGLLEATGSHAIIATHSAYLVREVSREQVHVFKRSKNGNISITPPRLRTFGADIDSISQFVFEEDIDNRLTDKVYEKIKGKTFESIEEELSKELSLSALMDLRARLNG